MDTKAPQGEQVASSPFFKTFLGKAEDYVKKPLRIKKLLNDSYQKASEKNDLGTIAHDAWETVQSMIRLVRASASGEYTGLPATTVVAAVAVLIYFLSPIDVIPDFIPVLGLLDDVALVAWFSTTLKDELDKFAEWEATRPVVVADDKAGDQEPAASTTLSVAADGADFTNARPESPAAAQPAERTTHGQPTAESAKKAGTTDLDTDQHPHTSVPASTTDSTRLPNVGDTATGGNVR